MDKQEQVGGGENVVLIGRDQAMEACVSASVSTQSVGQETASADVISLVEAMQHLARFFLLAGVEIGKKNPGSDEYAEQGRRISLVFRNNEADKLVAGLFKSHEVAKHIEETFDKTFAQWQEAQEDRNVPCVLGHMAVWKDRESTWYSGYPVAFGALLAKNIATDLAGSTTSSQEPSPSEPQAPSTISHQTENRGSTTGLEKGGE